jgi:hypothetical protein
METVQAKKMKLTGSHGVSKSAQVRLIGKQTVNSTDHANTKVGALVLAETSTKAKKRKLSSGSDGPSDSSSCAALSGSSFLTEQYDSPKSLYHEPAVGRGKIKRAQLQLPKPVSQARKKVAAKSKATDYFSTDDDEAVEAAAADWTYKR